MHERHVIATEDAPRAIGPYSQAIRSGGFLFCSGQIALDPGSGEVVGSTVTEQTDRALRNLAAVLEAGGSSLEDVLKTTVFLADMADFSEFNAVYGRFFPNHPPARSTVQAAGLPRGVRVEIEAVARVEDPT